MPYTFDKADTLIYSDNPEALSVSGSGDSAIHVATPLNAIIYEATVGAGRKRVFYYHKNFDSTPRTIAVRLVNLASTAVTLEAIKYIEPPAGDAVGVGHRSIVGFLKALIAGVWDSIPLRPVTQPGDDVVFAVSDAGQYRLASAFVELEIPANAQIKVQIITAASEADVADVGRNGPGPGIGDGLGRCGVYDLTRGGTCDGDSGAQTWHSNAAPLEIDVPSPPIFPNTKVPQVLAGRQPAEAVYGVFTKRTITFTNPTTSACDIGLYVEACGGDSPGTFMLNDDIIQLGCMVTGTTTADRPAYEIATYTIPAEDRGTTTIDVLCTVDPSGHGPLKIVVARAGTLPPPASAQQVVFQPGMVWQA